MTSVKTIRMGFLTAEDRLVMDFVGADHTVTMLVTRRIVRRVIQGLAQILVQSSPVLPRVPASHKTDMLVWEHLSALQPGEEVTAGDAAATPGHAEHPWQLLNKLDINAHPTSFQLRFEGLDGSPVVMVMSRNEVHRLLANLRKLARHAEWDIDTEVGWLVEADAPQMQTGILAS